MLRTFFILHDKDLNECVFNLLTPLGKKMGAALVGQGRELHPNLLEFESQWQSDM